MTEPASAAPSAPAATEPPPLNLSKLLADGLAKSDVIWLRTPDRTQLVWHAYDRDAILVVTGPGEQTIAPLPESVDVVIRSKDTGSRLLTISCVTLILDTSEPMWETAAAALAAERLNATDDQIERWRTEGTIYVLHPYGAPTDRPGAYPATSGAARFAPGRATTSRLRPRHVGGR